MGHTRLCSLKRFIVTTIWIGLGCLVITIFRAPSDYDLPSDLSRSRLFPLLRGDIGRQFGVQTGKASNMSAKEKYASDTSNNVGQKQNDNQKSGDEPKRVVKVVRVIRRVVQKVVTSDSQHYNTKDALKFYKQASKLRPSNKSTENGKFSVSKKLWRFNKVEAEKVFLYKQLLSKPWSPNMDHLRQFREELIYNPKRRPHMAIAAQDTTEIDGDLEFYIKSKTQRHEFNNGTHFRMNASVYHSLPVISPIRYRQFRKCSLVGNSGALLNNSCGQDIDDADFVFRCNAAPLKHHIKDAGKKSNFTTFNPSIFFKRFGGLASKQNITTFLHQMQEYSGYLWFPCLGSHRYTDVCINASFNYNNTENQFVLGHPDHFYSIWQFWKDRNFTKILSTGFYMTNFALTVCDELHLYGFWPFPTEIGDKMRTVPYHYFDSEHFSTSHAMNDEFMNLLQLHELGILRLHIDSCRR